MRITGGRARGIPLRIGKQSTARPATDRLREAVFSSLGTLVSGARFFDLFAGSGAYGLEAWSRGAGGGIFVETNRSMVEAIRQNSKAVANSLTVPVTDVEIAAADATRWGPVPGDRAKVIFIDPPYSMIPDVADVLFPKLGNWIEPDGVVVFEMPGTLDVAPGGWERFKRLGKGRHQPTCCFFRKTT